MKVLLMLATVGLLLVSAQVQFRSGSIRIQEVENSDGSVTLKATVTGGTPPANKFTWTLPDRTTLSPGETSGSFQATEVSEGQHELLCRDGYKSTTQQFSFRAENGWWAVQFYNLHARNTITRSPIVPGHIQSEVITNNDKSVTLKAIIIGGTPAANKFTWTLPDGTKITPGQTHGSFRAVQLSQTHHELRCSDGHISVLQRFTFRAENGWWATQSFTLSPVTTKVVPADNDIVFAELKGETTFNTDNSVTLEVTLTGGRPAPNVFQWTLPDNTTITPGQTRDSYQAFFVRLNTDGTSTYRLHMREGRKSSAQSVSFRCEFNGAGGWFNSIVFTVPALTQANVPGTVTGSSNIDWVNKVITINAEIIGGHPKANDFRWTVQYADGSHATFEAGNREASAVTTNSRGNLVTTLRLTDRASFWRRIKLDVASITSTGFRSWWANRQWNIPATA